MTLMDAPCKPVLGDNEQDLHLPILQPAPANSQKHTGASTTVLDSTQLDWNKPASRARGVSKNLSKAWRPKGAGAGLT